MVSDLVKLYPTGPFDPTQFYCQKLDVTVAYQEITGKDDIYQVTVISGGMWPIFTIRVGVHDIQDARAASKFIFTEINSHISQIRVSKASKNIYSISNGNGPQWVYIANRFRDLQGNKCIGTFKDGSRSDKRNPYLVLQPQMLNTPNINNVDLLIFCALLLAKQLCNRIKKSSRKYKQLVRQYGPFSNDA